MSMLLSRYFQAVDLSVLIKYKNLAYKKGALYSKMLSNKLILL